MPSHIENQIMTCLNQAYQIEVSTLTFLNWGADPHSFLYKAETKSGSTYFVKLRPAIEKERLLLIDWLHQVGIQEVIPPVKTVDGQLSHVFDDFQLIVFPFVEGEDGFKRSLTDDQWKQLGHALRQIHDLDLPAFIRKQIPLEKFATLYREKVRSLYPHQDLPQSETILYLVDRAEELAQLISKKELPFVLCHSDLHGGNVRLTPAGRLYIVDWDAPILAPKERDLMFIGGGVGNVWNQETEAQWFYQGYGESVVDPECIAYYRHERIVEDLAIYTEAYLEEPSSERFQPFIEIFQKGGVVDIALQTDPKGKFDG